jgi:uncharacterized membrane protein
MEITEFLQAIFRWFHVVAGIIWIGHLYFFNFVNGPFETTLDGDSKKKVVPQLRPRALFWFRWGAAWTWITGVLLLMIVFYHGRIVFDGDAGWHAGAFVMVAVTFLAFAVYDPVAKAITNNQTMAYVGLAASAVLILCYVFVGGFGYRATTIHMGALFGTLMAANVWMRIWPAQQKIITAIRDGQAPDAALVGMAGTRSRHNTYMSVPLVWMMLDQHSTVASTFLGLPSYAWTIIMIAVAWWIVMQLYTKAGAVKGF